MFSRLAKSLINFYHLERQKNVENFARKFQIFFQLLVGYGGEMLVLVVWGGWAGSIANSYSLSFHSLVLSVESSTLWSIDKWKNHKKAAQKFESLVRDPTVAGKTVTEKKYIFSTFLLLLCFFLFDLWLRSLKIVLGKKLFASFHILQSQWNINYIYRRTIDKKIFGKEK